MSRLTIRAGRGISRSSRLVACASALVLTAIGLTACSGGSSGGSETITVWQNGPLADAGYGYITQVGKLFEKAHPGVTVDFVIKPADNYFASLNTAYLSGNGPDVAQIYPGSYVASVQKNFADLNAYIPAAQRKTLPGIQYYSNGGDTAKGTYGLPSFDQFYNMWFNKALLAEAGISSPPSTFAEMASACTALRAKGITPYADGTPSFVSPGVGTTQDWSYLASAVYTTQQWDEILDGKIKYNSAPLVSQVASWAALFKAKCTSPNVTTEDGGAQFAAGKVAMMMNYSGLYPEYSKALGNKLGAMPPPWSTTPQKTLVEFPGSGYAVSKEGGNVKLAAQFVAFTVSAPAQQLVADSGEVPLTASVHAKGALGDLQNMARSGKYRLYPMFDNYMPSQVVAQINNALPQSFIGKQSAQSALDDFQQAYDSIPSSERTVQYHISS
jgi:multiple sugar transport system substrate-binding protein